MQTNKKNKGRSGRIIYGFILVGIGVYLQLWSMDLIPDFGQTWPVFIIIIGVAIILGAFFKSKKRENGQQV